MDIQSPSAASTPTQKSSPETPTSSTSKKRKRLTEDERMFREKERAEKRQKLEEEKNKKEDEKRRKEQERLEKLKQKEQERLEKERQKEQERLKREEQKEQERLKKEEENAKRTEEKQKKEEERLKKEEERLKKEEERKKALEEKERERIKLEEKKAKQAQHFTKFFQKSPAPVSKVRTLTVPAHQSLEGSGRPDVESDKENADKVENSNTEGTNSALADSNHIVTMENTDSSEEIKVVYSKKPEVPLFRPMPFEIKSNMAVAPLLRRKTLTALERNAVDKCFTASSSESSDGSASDFLDRCRNKKCRRTGRTEIEVDGEVRVIIQDVEQTEEGLRRYRKKLLQFKENRRPAYWGTWRKCSKSITGRRPFAKEKELDYEFDSDDEWEDEPDDAEEIENSEGEDEAPEDPGEGEPVDEENDDGWMVPHGYLSDSEREGEGDIKLAKSKEIEFFRSLKEQVKLGIPVIQTIKLSNYRIIFPARPEVRRSTRTPKVPKGDIHAKGFLAMELPSDDENDKEWDENDTSVVNEGEEDEFSSASSVYDSEEHDSEMDEDEVDLEHECSGGEEHMETDSDDEDLFTPVKVKKGSVETSPSVKAPSKKFSSSPESTDGVTKT